MGDNRTYEHVICLRMVSLDGMTADWYDLPNDVLKYVLAGL